MPPHGYLNICLKAPILEKIRAFQILAITKRQRLYTSSETLELALELATQQLNQEETKGG